jgi:hypothetical protein
MEALKVHKVVMGHPRDHSEQFHKQLLKKDQKLVLLLNVVNLSQVGLN